MGGELRVGTSGWHYDHWAGDFYPRELPRPRWFDHYAARFSTVEINNTFYRLPRPAAFECWHDQAPRGFLYAVKFSRYATHMRKLLEPAEPLGRFLEGAERLGQHLGPILVQLPPRWSPDPERLDAFLAAAPRHLRWTIEVREERWLCPEVLAILRRYEAALCVHDLIERHPFELTAGWTYFRYHGDRRRPDGGYTAQRLRADATRLQHLLDQKIDVYVYFNNDQHGCAPRNAQTLLRYLQPVTS